MRIEEEIKQNREFENPYEVSGTGNFLIGFVYYLFIYGTPLLILIFLFFIIKKIIRSTKK